MNPPVILHSVNQTNEIPKKRHFLKLVWTLQHAAHSVPIHRKRAQWIEVYMEPRRYSRTSQALDSILPYVFQIYLSATWTKDNIPKQYFLSACSTASFLTDFKKTAFELFDSYLILQQQLLFWERNCAILT